MHYATKILSEYICSKNENNFNLYTVWIDANNYITIEIENGNVFLTLHYTLDVQTFTLNFLDFTGNKKTDTVLLSYNNCSITATINKATAVPMENLLKNVMFLDNFTGQEKYFKKHKKFVIWFMNFLTLFTLKTIHQFLKATQTEISLFDFGYFEFAQKLNSLET